VVRRLFRLWYGVRLQQFVDSAHRVRYGISHDRAQFHARLDALRLARDNDGPSGPGIQLIEESEHVVGG